MWATNGSHLTPPTDIDSFSATAALSTTGLDFIFMKHIAKKAMSLVASATAVSVAFGGMVEMYQADLNLTVEY